MAYLSDIEIAQRCKPEHIGVIAKRAHVDESTSSNTETTRRK